MWKKIYKYLSQRVNLKNVPMFSWNLNFKIWDEIECLGENVNLMTHSVYAKLITQKIFHTIMKMWARILMNEYDIT